MAIVVAFSPVYKWAGFLEKPLSFRAPEVVLKGLVATRPIELFPGLFPKRNNVSAGFDLPKAHEFHLPSG
ncbi:MAG: hypothetical protein SWE60_22145 [Thermodesulfobacteriota bacterium]|nr:hypothetical protein [Thermodesulfobacteriota bacterium]